MIVKDWVFVLWFLRNDVAETSIKLVKSHCTPKPGDLIRFFCLRDLVKVTRSVFFVNVLLLHRSASFYSHFSLNKVCMNDL